ncbi:vWA domain-containing protein [Actinocorallia sp. B10E7]|uniref:vWA domain-containing protein n=1 Tax=Actinocorallia sp. B10E7 TaxID=3153558 RepID=UPI00325CA2D9
MDGLFTYESEIARLNASGRLAERLVPVRPDGAVAARYTLRPLLEPRTREAGERLSRLTGLLLAGDTQRRIAELTHRRPGAPGVEPPGALAGPVLRPLDVPEDQYVVNRLVDAYLGRYRYDARMLFLLNVSGSMRGVRLERLREAAVRLAGAPLADTPAVGDMHLIFVPFGARPGELRQIRLSGWAPANVEGEVRALMGGLVPRGEAAIYDALVAGYRELGGFHEEDRVVSVILITDGSNGRGRDLDGFLRHRAALAPGLRAVPVYPVLVGGAGESEMRELADRTGGRVLDARGESLAEEFLTARAGR